MKERLDIILVNKGLATSREKAKAMIMEGIVYVNGQKEDKAGTMFDIEAPVEVRGQTLRYVSRGGLKLEKARSDIRGAIQDALQQAGEKSDRRGTLHLGKRDPLGRNASDPLLCRHRTGGRHCSGNDG